MANFLFYHVDLKAIKTIDPVKRVSVLYLVRFLRNVVLKLMPWCRVNGNKYIYIYIHISSRFIYSKMTCRLGKDCHNSTKTRLNDQATETSLIKLKLGKFFSFTFLRSSTLSWQFSSSSKLHGSSTKFLRSIRIIDIILITICIPDLIGV